MPIRNVSIPVNVDRLLNKSYRLTLGSIQVSGRTLAEAGAALALEIEPHPDCGAIVREHDATNGIWVAVCFAAGWQYLQPSGCYCLMNRSVTRAEALAAMRRHMEQQ